MPVRTATGGHVSIDSTAVQLVRFVPVTDFVTYDLNGDGRTDLLALSSRTSDGYGYVGVGNGLFCEGQTFDLPFRPAGAASLPSGVTDTPAIFLVSSEEDAALFWPTDCGSAIASTTPMEHATACIQTTAGTRVAAWACGSDTVRVYAADADGVSSLGEWRSDRAPDAAAWCRQVIAWGAQPEGSAFPLPPRAGGDRTTCLGDINGDGILDVAYCRSGAIVLLLSENGEPLVLEQSIPIAGTPVAVRIADVDGDGRGDVLALNSPANTLWVFVASGE